jgi:hypothetical protein
MYKTMQLILNFLYKKKIFPFMQIHVHWVNLMEKKKFNQKVTSERTIFLNHFVSY